MTVNENQIPIYVLQPEISGQIKQTTLEEIKNWIKDGELQPHHQVRIKNLSWVEAQTIPVFQSLFESKKNEQTDQSDHFSNQSLPDASASEKIKPEIKKTPVLSKETPLPNADNAANEESKPVEPSAVFKAYEKKALAKSKPNKQKTEAARPLHQSPKKSSVVKQTIGFLAGCILAFLLSFGGSYFWVYQLKTPVEIDEKSVPGLANLDNKLTADKLDLRFKEAAKEQKLKESGQPGNVQQMNVSQQIAQLEKQYNAQRKIVIENHRNKLKDTDFTATFSFSSVVLLGLFLLARIFYGKTSKPVEQQFPSKPPAPHLPELSDIDVLDGEDIEVDILENIETEESFEEIDESFTEKSPAESSGKKEIFDEISNTAEDAETEAVQTTAKCFLHREKVSAFVCEDCDNHYCDECFKTFVEQENCCPFCKAVCKSVETEINNSSAKKNKKVNLLELGKDSDFVVYDFPEERSSAAGVIQAFVIAFLFATAVSILWVYKVSPYLENRRIAQNISPNKAENSAQQTADNSAENTADTETNITDDKPCIDPETGQPFECDAETRRALFEHTRKVESVEQAKKNVDAKTKLLTDSNPSSEESSSENAEQKAAEKERNSGEKRQLIQAFLISFVIVFGLLLSIVFFSKDKKTFLAQDDPADS